MSKIQINSKAILPALILIGVLWMSFMPDNSPAVMTGQLNSQPQYEVLKAEASDYESQAKKLEEEAKLKAQKAEALKKLAETEEAITNLDVEQKVSVSSIDTPAVQAVIEPKTDQRPAIEAYRAKYFPNSPVTTDMIMATSEKYQIPAGMILAFGHNESHMGTKGRAVQTKNPMNVGNTDAGDYKAVRCGFANNCLSDWQAGLDAFASLISRCYFNEGEAINLQTMIDRDFRAVRCNVKGKRYQTDTRAKMKYEERIRNLKSFNITY
jgi:hypothetical protein